jgi:hypothetical protein
LVSYMALQPSFAPIVCDLQMLCTIVTSSTKAIKSLRCSYSTCIFIKHVPKKVLYVIMHVSPFVFFPIKEIRTPWGKQMLHLNCWTPSQLEKSPLFTTQKAHGTYLQLSLQQHGAILRSKYHRKQQRKMFPKSRCCEP